MPKLLLPEVPDSFCPNFNKCPIARLPRCNFSASATCGLFPKRKTIPYIERVLNRSPYWNMTPLHKIAFIKSYFGVNTEESEAESRPYIAKIIFARMVILEP